MENYETLGVLGEGTYGVVIKARHRVTGQVVAIKKFKQAEDDDHVRKTSLREVKVLKQLHHPNVISLVEVFRREGKLYLVFEYIENTILQLLEATTHGLKPLEVKKFMYQLLRGVDYCHAHSVIHRDVKPENILVSRDGMLKVCDFGFARHMTTKGKYTDYVATRWYRAPELLVGDVAYGKAVDVWAIGCILAELSDSQPLFPGDSDLDQLALILRTCGPVPEHMVQTFERNPLYRRVAFPHPSRGIHRSLPQRYPHQSPEWMEFLTACLRTDPEERPSCAELMQFAYFTTDNFRVEYERELERMATAATPWLYPEVANPLRSCPMPGPESPQKSDGKGSKNAAGGGVPVEEAVNSTTSNASNGCDDHHSPPRAAPDSRRNTQDSEGGKWEDAPLTLPDITLTVSQPLELTPSEDRTLPNTNANSSHTTGGFTGSLSGKNCFNGSLGNPKTPTAAADNHGGNTNGNGEPLPHLGLLWSQYLSSGGGGGGGGGVVVGKDTATSPHAVNASNTVAPPFPAKTSTAAAAAVGTTTTTTSSSVTLPMIGPHASTMQQHNSSLFGAGQGKGKAYYASTTGSSGSVAQSNTNPSNSSNAGSNANGAMTVPSLAKPESRRQSISIVSPHADGAGGFGLSPRATTKKDTASPSSRRGNVQGTTAEAAAGQRERRSSRSHSRTCSPPPPTTSTATGDERATTREAPTPHLAKDNTTVYTSLVNTPDSGEHNGITSPSAPSSPLTSPQRKVDTNTIGSDDPPTPSADGGEGAVPAAPSPQPWQAPVSLPSPAETPTRRAKRKASWKGVRPPAVRNESAKRASAALQALSQFSRANSSARRRRSSQHKEELAGGEGGALGEPQAGPTSSSRHRIPSPRSQSITPNDAAGRNTDNGKRAAAGGLLVRKKLGGGKGRTTSASSTGTENKVRSTANKVAGGGGGGGAKQRRKRRDEREDASSSTALGRQRQVSNPLHPRQPTLRQSTYNYVPQHKRGTGTDATATGDAGGGYSYSNYHRGSNVNHGFPSHKLGSKQSGGQDGGTSQSTEGGGGGGGNTLGKATGNAGYLYGQQTRSLRGGYHQIDLTHGTHNHDATTGEDGAGGGGCGGSSRLEELLAGKGLGMGNSSLPQLFLGRGS